MQIDELPRLSDEEATHVAACDLDREASRPTDLPDGFPAISDVRLAKLIGEAQDKTLHSALTELRMRREPDFSLMLTALSTKVQSAMNYRDRVETSAQAMAQRMEFRT